MSESTVSRTLVKSPPELWAACSDPATLGRHLEPFGEIRITRLEPETTVAWEGERASGTVRIEPSGWGTRVTLTASSPDPKPSRGPESAPVAPLPPPPLAPEPRPRPQALEPPPMPAPVEPPAPVAPEPPPVAFDPTPGPRPPQSSRERQGGLFSRLRAWLAGPEPSRPVPETARVAPEPSRPRLEAPRPAPERPRLAPPPPSRPAEPTEPEPGPPAADPGPPAPEDPSPTAAALDAALDSLGQAHHRPFSRS